jgi:hypothetical protein
LLALVRALIIKQFYCGHGACGGILPGSSRTTGRIEVIRGAIVIVSRCNTLAAGDYLPLLFKPNCFMHVLQGGTDAIQALLESS